MLSPHKKKKSEKMSVKEVFVAYNFMDHKENKESRIHVGVLIGTFTKLCYMVY